MTQHGFYFENKLDNVGRMVIPKPIREQLGLAAGDTLRFAAVEDGILLTVVRADLESRSK